MWFWTSLANLCIYSCFIQYPCVFIKGSGHWAPSWPNSPLILLLESRSGKNSFPFEWESPKHKLYKLFLAGWIQILKTSPCIYENALWLFLASSFLVILHVSSRPLCALFQFVHGYIWFLQHTVGQVLHANCIFFFSFFYWASLPGVIVSISPTITVHCMLAK